MITKALAMYLGHGTVLYHKSLANRDGSPLRCRVNGKCRVWKRRPSHFELPVKHGLRMYFYITPDDGYNWCWPDLIPHLAGIAGLSPETDLGIIRDKLMEDGREEIAQLLDLDVLGQYTVS